MSPGWLLKGCHTSLIIVISQLFILLTTATTKLCFSSCVPYFRKELSHHPIAQESKGAIILDSFLSPLTKDQSPNFFSLPNILIFFLLLIHPHCNYTGSSYHNFLPRLCQYLTCFQLKSFQSIHNHVVKVIFLKYNLMSLP